MTEPLAHRCGFIAIVGRPNVGKSTLMNRILGQKISITSRKPQTTRHQILGIKTDENVQAIYVDTPGLHLHAKKAINRYMNRAASTVLNDVDVVVFVVDAARWTEEDDNVLVQLQREKTPVILVINKIDKLNNKDLLLPLIDTWGRRMEFAAVIPISAKSGDNLDKLEQTVSTYLPESGPLFPEEQVTDRSERFLAAELIREKLMRRLSKELPYAVTVQIEKFSMENEVLHIDATIWVARKSQKGIVIGKSGEVLKEVGQKARIDMEKQFECKVFLNLWVKVMEDWSDKEQQLRQLGYDDSGS
jgi:GTP-binding protein Era